MGQRYDVVVIGGRLAALGPEGEEARAAVATAGELAAVN